MSARQRWAVRRAGSRYLAELLCTGLLLLMGANLLSVAARKSLTADEYVHIPAGYIYLVAADFRPNSEHPPLAKLWSALPLLALEPEAPTVPTEGQAATPGQRTLLTGRWFWEANVGTRGRLETLVFWARAPMVLLTLALGALIFAWARRLFGARAALLAVALFSLEPTLLAHGRIVHTDVPAALAYLACFAALHHYAAAPTARGAALLGLAAGAAFATKYSLLILTPVVAVAMAATLWLARRLPVARQAIAGHAAVAALVALVVIHATYFFQDQPLETTALAGFERLAPLLPDQFLYGLYTVATHNQEGHPAALLGQQSAQGWWYYFPVAFALKTALPFLVLSIAALAWALWRLLARRDGRMQLVLVPFGLYLALAMASRINIGIRHLLPAYPFLFILGGAALDRLLRVRVQGAVSPRRPSAPGRAARATAPVAPLAPVALVTLTLGWMALEAARVYPDYLPYMNQLARPRPPWHYLSDSNVEWGEDVGELARYLGARGETRVVGALATGRETLRFHGVEYLDAVGPPPAQPPRYIAIGASFFNASTVRVYAGGRDDAAPGLLEEPFAEYRTRAPEAVFGRSIYLYPARPAAPPLSTPLPDAAFRATVTPLDPPRRLQPGQTATIRVRVRNGGEVVWPRRGQAGGRYQVRLGNHWLGAGGEVVRLEDGRGALPYNLEPGQEAEVRLEVTTPAAPGDYLLELDLVQEGVAWFGQRQSPTARVPVRVEP